MRARRAFVVLLAAGAAAFFTAAPAQAHALLKSSVPADGSTVQQPPKTIQLVFTEPPEQSLSVVSILDSSGHTVSGVGKPTVPSGNQEELVTPVRPGSLSNGVYTVTWRTVSKTDGHVTAGSISFGVGVPVTGTIHPSGAPSTPSPSVLAVTSRWLFYWGVAILLGGAVACALLFEWGLPAGGRWLLLGAWLAAAVGVALMTVAERSTVGLPLGTVLSSPTGHQLIARAAGVVLCGLAALWLTLRRSRASIIALGVVTVATMFVHAQAGHADTQSSVRILNLLDQWAHLLAVGVWIGGLPWLLLGLRGDRAARAVRGHRFSVMAMYALVVVGVTGVLRAIPEVGSLHGLFHTSFGLTLLVKTGLFLILIGLGARNHFGLVPRMHPDGTGVDEATPPLRRSVSWELVVAAAILAATAVLSELPPASYVVATSTSSRAPQHVVVHGSDFATTVRVQLTATPGTVGTNTFVTKVADYDTGKPVNATSVQLQFSFPGNPNVASTLDLQRASAGTWTGSGTQLSIDGLWNVDVVIQEATASTDVQLQLRTKLPPERITSVVTPGQPTIWTIALGGNLTLQTYVDPGSRGPNTVHYTFFNGQNEQPISDATAKAESPSGNQIDTKLIRFDSGHFGANVTLTSGRWTFFIEATTASGQHLSAYFPQTIGQ
jgi:copper transport protein